MGDDEKLEGLKKENSTSELNNIQETKPVLGLGRGLKKEASCFDLKQHMEDEKSQDDSYKNNLESSKVISCGTTLDVPAKNDSSIDSSEFKDEDFIKYNGPVDIKPSTSFTSLEEDSKAGCSKANEKQKESGEFVRSKSVPPESQKPDISDELKSRYKYCGVKFNFQQYPQIVTNYMKSKNIELSRLPFAQKEIDFNQITLGTGATFNFMDSDDSGEEVEALQTPSNASELECVSDLVTERHKECYAKETVERLPKTFVRAKVPNTVIKESVKEEEGSVSKQEKDEGKLKVVPLPMPK